MSELYENNGKEVPIKPKAETNYAYPLPQVIQSDHGVHKAPASVVHPIPSPEILRRRSGSVIAIDIDDTIAGYVAHFVREYGWPESFERAYEDKSILYTSWPDVDLEMHFSDEVHIPFCAQILPIDGAWSACTLLLRNGFPIVYLSSRPKSHRDMTIDWLEQWQFPVAPLYLMDGGEAKREMMMHLDITALIDDRCEDLIYARNQGISTFIVDRPWNRDLPGLYRCFDWTHILDTIDRFWLPIG